MIKKPCHALARHDRVGGNTQLSISSDAAVRKN